MENWKDIEGYEGLYQVSSDTTVKSLERTITRGNGRLQTIKERILKPRLDRDGYLTVILCKNGAIESKKVHQLVAQAFIENPNNYTDVHHRNHDKTDNRIENLCWIDKKKHEAMHADEKAKTVYQYTLDGLLVNVWESTREAARQLGFSQSHIAECCRSELKKHKGYRWSYEPL